MKKLFVPLALLLVVIFVVTGCSSAATTTTAPATTTTASSTTPAATTSKPAATTPAASAASPTKPAASSPAAGSPKTGGTLRMIESVGPGTPIGSPWETSGSSVVTMQLAEQALLREEIDGSMTPMLATSYDVNNSADAPSITFHLRQGVTFTDGTVFNAAAVKFNLDKWKASNMAAGTTSYWKSFDILDDYTIRMNFTEYRNTLLRSMGDAYFMVSPAAFDKNGIDWLRWNMVGTGPFMQQDFQRDVTTKTIKNPTYWDAGKPYLDGVQILYVADELTFQALFKSGGADVLNAGTKVAANFQNQGYNTITQKGGPNILVPDSANADSPWSNLKVRQAAEYALDKEALAKAFGFGFGQAAYQMSSPTTLAYDASLPGRKYDVAKAKQLMTDAGYPNGFKSTIICNPQGLNKDVVIAIQAYFKTIGITVDLQFPEAAQMQQYLSGAGGWKNGLLYTPMSEWANYNTTLNFYFGVPSFWFSSMKKPDGWKDLFNASIHAAKPDATLLKACSDAAYNDSMVIPTFYTSTAYVLSPKVHDTGLGTRGISFYWNPQDAWLDK